MMKSGLIKPGEAPWFPGSDWTCDSYVWGDGGEVWLSLMIAQKPGTGALSRLMTEVEAMGTRIVVPAPFPLMEAIIRAKGFLPDETGQFFRRPV